MKTLPQALLIGGFLLGLTGETMANGIIPTSGLVSLTAKTFPEKTVKLLDVATVKVPFGMKRDRYLYDARGSISSPFKEERGVGFRLELKASKGFWQGGLFSSSEKQLLSVSLFIGKPGVDLSSFTGSHLSKRELTIEGYSHKVILEDDYSEDGHSNHKLTVIDSVKNVSIEMLIDKTRFSKKQSIDILSTMLKSIEIKPAALQSLPGSAPKPS